MILVTRIAATLSSQIASDCSCNSKSHCDSENTLRGQLFGLGVHQLCVVFIVLHKRHVGLRTTQNNVCDYKAVIPNCCDFFGPMPLCDCDTAILPRFLQEKLATWKLWLPIASDLWLGLRGSVRLWSHCPFFGAALTGSTCWHIMCSVVSLRIVY